MHVKKRLLAAMIAAAIALSGLGVAPAQAKTADTGTVKITVLAKDGTPLPGVDVEIGDYNFGDTNAKGVFKSRELEPGIYDVKVEVRANTWQTKRVTVTANEDSAATITVKGGAILATFTAPKKIVKAGLASADVYNAKGKWMDSVYIYWKDNKTTTARGISNLPAGSYTVVFQGANTTKKVTVKKDQTTKVKLTRPAGYAISGTVTKHNGKPYAKQWVNIYDANDTWLGSAKTDAKGKYKVPGAVKGKYKVEVGIPDCDSAGFVGTKAAKTVKIKGAKATVNLRVPKPAKVTGKVVNSKGKAVKIGVVHLRGNNSSCAMTKSDGTYTLEVYHSGTYSIEAYAYDAGGTGKTAKKKVTLGKTVTFPTITLK
jgi:hypothetical protein